MSPQKRLSPSAQPAPQMSKEHVADLVKTVEHIVGKNLKGDLKKDMVSPWPTPRAQQAINAMKVFLLEYANTPQNTKGQSAPLHTTKNNQWLKKSTNPDTMGPQQRQALHQQETRLLNQSPVLRGFMPVASSIPPSQWGDAIQQAKKQVPLVQPQTKQTTVKGNVRGVQTGKPSPSAPSPQATAQQEKQYSDFFRAYVAQHNDTLQKQQEDTVRAEKEQKKQKLEAEEAQQQPQEEHDALKELGDQLNTTKVLLDEEFRAIANKVMKHNQQNQVQTQMTVQQPPVQMRNTKSVEGPLEVLRLALGMKNAIKKQNQGKGDIDDSDSDIN